MILTNFRLFRCEFMKIPVNQSFINSNGSAPNGLDLLPPLYFGIFLRRKIDIRGLYVSGSGVNVAYSSTCVRFTSGVKGFDGWWIAVAVLQLVAWVVGFVLVVNLFFSTLCGCSRPVYYSVGVIFLLICTTCQALVFLIYLSNFCRDSPEINNLLENTIIGPGAYENFCVMGPGSIMVIISAAFYMFAGMMCFCIGQKPRGEMDGGKAITEEQAEGPVPVVTGLETEEKVADEGDAEAADAPVVTELDDKWQKTDSTPGKESIYSVQTIGSGTLDDKPVLHAD